MKKVVRILIAIMIIFSLIGFGIFVFNYYNMKELQTLTAEVNNLLEIDLTKEEINSNIKSNGGFGKVERIIKTYLIDSQKIYKDMVSVYDELNADSLFYGEDIDAQKLKDIQNNLNSYSQKAKDLSDKYKEQNTSEKKKEYANNLKGITSLYYKDVYNSLIDSEVVNNELLLVNDQVDIEYQNIITRIYNTDKVIDFLIENEKSWEINNGRIQFNNVNKLAQYYEILNKDVQE